MVCVGGFAGGALRYVFSATLNPRWPIPAGTLLANTLASFGIGLAYSAALGANSWALVGVGFCGGLSTFSATCYEMVNLWGDDRGALGRGSKYLVATVVACGIAFAVGQRL